MKKLISLAAAILAVVFVHAQASIQSTRVAIAKGEKVIASTVTANRHLYVFTAPESSEFEGEKYKVKGKVTLMHFDENRKLILKKPLAIPLVGGVKIKIDAAFEVGNQLLVFGTSDSKKDIRTTCYFTVDKNTLAASKKVNALFESSIIWNFGFSRPDHVFEYAQSAPGTALAVQVQYATPVTKTSGFSSSREYHFRYYMIDLAGAFTEALKFDHEGFEEDRTPKSMLMSAEGKLYVLSIIYPHVEYDWEAHKITSASEDRLKKGDYDILLNVINASGGRESLLMEFADSTLFLDQGKLFSSDDGVYVAGMADDGANNYIKVLNGDTSELKTSSYLFSQKIDFSKSGMTIARANCVAVGDQLEALTTDSTLSDDDRSIWNMEQVHPIECNRLSDGTVLFSFVMYVHWRYRPYEEIKNSSHYSFERDDKGTIISISSTDPDATEKFDYKSMITFSLSPSGTVTATQAPMTMVIEVESFRMLVMPTAFYSRSLSNANEAYYVQPTGTDEAKLVCWNSATGTTTCMNAASGISIAECSLCTLPQSVLIINGKGEFVIVEAGQ